MLGSSLADRGKIDPIAGVWAANIIVSLLGLLLARKLLK
jgi:lipopolysaccharide export LptBFGC system permease protein LptF